MTDNKRRRAEGLADDPRTTRQERGSALANPTNTGSRILGSTKSGGSILAGHKTRKAVKKSAAKKAVPSRAATGRSARRNENAEEGIGKQSVSMPRETLRVVKELAEAEGVSVSRWMTQAADERAARERRAAVTRAYGAEYVAEYEAEHGPIPAEAIDTARRILGLNEDQADAA